MSGHSGSPWKFKETGIWLLEQIDLKLAGKYCFKSFVEKLLVILEFCLKEIAVTPERGQSLLPTLNIDLAFEGFKKFMQPENSVESW